MSIEHEVYIYIFIIVLKIWCDSFLDFIFEFQIHFVKTVPEKETQV